MIHPMFGASRRCQPVLHSEFDGWNCKALAVPREHPIGPDTGLFPFTGDDEYGVGWGIRGVAPHSFLSRLADVARCGGSCARASGGIQKEQSTADPPPRCDPILCSFCSASAGAEAATNKKKPPAVFLRQRLRGQVEYSFIGLLQVYRGAIDFPPPNGPILIFPAPAPVWRLPLFRRPARMRLRAAGRWHRRL